MKKSGNKKINDRYLLLAGSGEYTGHLVDADINLLKMIADHVLDGTYKPRVALFPTAAGAESDYLDWNTRGIKHFRKLGARPIGFNILDKLSAETPEKFKDLENCDFIYFSGGSPIHLYFTLINTPLYKKVVSLYNSGAVLAGCSAGAIIWGNKLFDYKSVFENNAPVVWKNAFNLIPYVVIPHFDRIMRDMSEISGKLLTNILHLQKGKILALDENTAVVIKNEKEAQVFGEGKAFVYQGRDQAKYKTGSKFKI